MLKIIRVWKILQSDFFPTYLILPLFVLNALVVTHSREGDGGVERDPLGREQPVQEAVQLFAQEKPRLGHEVSHLKKKNRMLLSPATCENIEGKNCTGVTRQASFLTSLEINHSYSSCEMIIDGFLKAA